MRTFAATLRSYTEAELNGHVFALYSIAFRLLMRDLLLHHSPRKPKSPQHKRWVVTLAIQHWRILQPWSTAVALPSGFALMI
ncbi:hypothetical protein AB6A40_007414 [Gnathostoma spinigerum]|uniref:Uncharacterized protein n=1 Tax=Gnathostoma spinigerum TaxID=75299 RepID=A0ABD6EL57_9BILA